MAKLTWDDVGQEFDPAQRTVIEEEASPHKSLGRKAYERFWGTDVDEDPLEFIRLGSQLVGGISGSLAGAASGGLVGSAVAPGLGTVAGAGLGAMIGGFGGGMIGVAAPEGVMEAAEFLGVANEGTRDRLGLSDKELDTVVEGEAILDMLTGGGLIGARAGVRAFGRAVSGIRKGGKKALAEFAAQHGVNMLPVQIGGRELPRGFISVLGKFPIVAGPIRRNIAKTEKEFKEAFENFSADIAPITTVSELSHEVFMDAKNLVNKTAKEFKARRDDIYRQADHAGSKVLPTETVSRVSAVLAEIGKETPATPKFRKKAKVTATMGEVQRFLANEIAPIFRKQKSGNIIVAPQSLKQMSTVLDKIDEKIAMLAKREGVVAEEAIDRLQRVRQAAQIDVYTNIQGEFGKDIVQDLKAIDRQQSMTIADLFNTTAAKKFGLVRKGGLSHLNMSDVPTRQSMDNLTDILLKGGDVKELEEVHRLVEPGTFRKMAAYSISKQIENAYDDGGKVLDIAALSKSLGLHAPKSNRYAYTKKMLDLAGGLKMDDLEKLAEIGDLIGKIEAPNASVFIARRGVMGGLEGIIRGLIPTAMTGAAGSTVGGPGLGIMSTLMFAGGSHMVGRMITDPRLARPVHKVLDKEAKSLVKKGAALQIGRIFANSMNEDGEWTMSEALDWRRNFEKTLNSLMREIEVQRKISESKVPTGG